MTDSHTKTFIDSMPKIDLHCHLDGSLSVAFVKNTLGLQKDSKELEQELRAPDICSGLAEYLERFELPIRCLMTPADIRDSVYDVIQHASEENIKYIELRFAPACSVNDTQSYTDIYEAAIEGTRKAQMDFGVYASIIACAMRHHSEGTNLAVLKSAREYLGCGVCALDLAGDEAAFPNELFANLFAEANRLDMPFTIHSGECHSVENVRLALSFGAKRVGHGIALINDKALMTECKKAHLGLELCPTSNYQTQAVTAGDAYPLKHFLDAGLLATINTDNRTVSNTTITKELYKIYDEFCITEDEIRQLYKNSVDISFADESIKHQLLMML